MMDKSLIFEGEGGLGTDPLPWINVPMMVAMITGNIIHPEWMGVQPWTIWK